MKGKLERVTGILSNELGLQLVPFDGSFTADEEKFNQRGRARSMRLYRGPFTNDNFGPNATNAGFAIRLDHSGAPGLKQTVAELDSEARSATVYSPDLPPGVPGKLRLIDDAKLRWLLHQATQYTNVLTWEDLQPFLIRGTNEDLSGFINPPIGAYVIGSLNQKPQFRPNTTATEAGRSPAQ